MGIVKQTYEEARLEFFKKKVADTKSNLRYWEQKASETAYLSYEREQATKCAEQLNFYRDAVKAFGGVEDGGTDSYNPACD